MNTSTPFKTKSQTKIKLVSVSSTCIPLRVPSHVRYQNKKCAFPLTTESRYVLAKLSPLGPFWLDWRSFGCMWVSPGLTRLHLVQREIASNHLAGGGWLDAKNQVGERGIALWEESGVWYAMKANQPNHRRELVGRSGQGGVRWSYSLGDHRYRRITDHR